MLIQALIGGLLIGLASAGLLLLRGQLAGISSVLGNVLFARGGEGSWRWYFIIGLFLAPMLMFTLTGQALDVRVDLPKPLLVVAGLLVGFGTRLANGCTSGHGVCGLGNLSLRSLVAVMVFMGTAALTVFVYRHLWLGA